MAQPTGSTSLNSTWTGKGLKAGIYITSGGPFVFDNSSPTVSATPNLGWTASGSDTDISSPYGDTKIKLQGGGSSDIGYLHATTGMGSAFGDSMTFVFDCSPPVVGAGSYDNSQTEFFNWGSGDAGQIILRGAPKSGDTVYRVEFLVSGAAYGPARSAYIDFSTAAHRRLAFRYVRGNPIEIFVDGVSQTPTGATNDFSGATPLPSATKQLLGWRPYTITPTASHLHIFNTALSDTDIAALAADPWQVYGAGGGGVTTTISSALANIYGSVASKVVPKTGVVATLANVYAGLGSVSGSAITTITAALAGVVGSVANTGSTANGTFTSEVLKDYAGNILSNVSLNFVRFYNDTTGALVLNKTGVSTNGSGIVTFSDASLVAGVTYRVDWETAAGSRRMPRKAAS